MLHETRKQELSRETKIPSYPAKHIPYLRIHSLRLKIAKKNKTEDNNVDQEDSTLPQRTSRAIRADIRVQTAAAEIGRGSGHRSGYVSRKRRSSRRRSVGVARSAVQRRDAKRLGRTGRAAAEALSGKRRGTDGYVGRGSRTAGRRSAKVPPGLVEDEHAVGDDEEDAGEEELEPDVKVDDGDEGVDARLEPGAGLAGDALAYVVRPLAVGYDLDGEDHALA